MARQVRPGACATTDANAEWVIPERAKREALKSRIVERQCIVGSAELPTGARRVVDDCAALSAVADQPPVSRPSTPLCHVAVCDILSRARLVRRTRAVANRRPLSVGKNCSVVPGSSGEARSRHREIRPATLLVLSTQPSTSRDGSWGDVPGFSPTPGIPPKKHAQDRAAMLD